MNRRKEIKDLADRLYYCSDSKEGRKVRKWIEKRIIELELEEQKQGEQDQ